MSVVCACVFKMYFTARQTYRVGEEVQGDSDFSSIGSISKWPPLEVVISVGLRLTTRGFFCISDMGAGARGSGFSLLLSQAIIGELV